MIDYSDSIVNTVFWLLDHFIGLLTNASETKLVFAHYMMAQKIVIDDSDKANLLNNYFVSIGTIDNGILPPTGYRAPSTHKLQQLLISFIEANVTAAIRKLKNNLSSGPDGLPPKLSLLAVTLPHRYSHAIYSANVRVCCPRNMEDGNCNTRA